MEFGEKVVLQSGESSEFSFKNHFITVKFEAGIIRYQRFDIDSDELLFEKDFLLKDQRRARLKFRPLYPDRPVVVKPSINPVVPPGEKGQFFLTIPLSFERYTAVNSIRANFVNSAG